MPLDGLRRTLDVYALYWVNGMRHHLVLPYRDYKGLIVVSEENCKIINSSIDGFILRKSGNGSDILVHWSVSASDLLDRLIDPPDEDAMRELERRLNEDIPPPVDRPDPTSY